MKAAAGADAGSCPPKKKPTTPLALVPNRNPSTPHVWHRSGDSDSVAAASRRSSSQTLNIYCCLFLGSEMFPAPNNRCVFWSPGQQQRSGVTRPDVACQRKFTQLRSVKKPSQFRSLGVLISLRLNFTRRDVTKRVTPGGKNISRLLHGPDDGTNRCTCRVNLPFLEKAKASSQGGCLEKRPGKR